MVPEGEVRDEYRPEFEGDPFGMGNKDRTPDSILGVLFLVLSI